MAGEEMSFFISPPHFGQRENGGSLIPWRISMRSLQLVHWYS
jgi:hypothetical protein